MLGLRKGCVVVAALTLLSVGCESIKDSLVTLLLEVLPDSPQGGEQDVSGVVAAWGDPVVSSQSHDVRTEQGVELFDQWNHAGGTGVPGSPAPVGDTKFSHD